MSVADTPPPIPRGLSRVMPCPTCGHDHLHLPCDFCDCTEQTVPGVHPPLE